jgi:hypothetical protein
MMHKNLLIYLFNWKINVKNINQYSNAIKKIENVTRMVISKFINNSLYL